MTVIPFKPLSPPRRPPERQDDDGLRTCITCAHRVQVAQSFIDVDMGTGRNACRAPQNLLPPDPETGLRFSRHTWCSEHRERASRLVARLFGYCGQSGAWWTPKEGPPA